MKRSPLHELNLRLGARFVDFGGWEMPVQYQSVLSEHRAVREAVGVFDVTHLGRFALTGPGSRSAIHDLFCNDIDRIEPGRCQYTLMLTPDGGIIDDLIVWWWGSDDFWVMPNAANHERVMNVFSQSDGCEVQDLQGSSVFLAVQGPGAPQLIENVLRDKPRRFRNRRLEWHGSTVSMAGTGYTGEAGAELCAPPEIATQLMEKFVEAGAVPCGLGARDTLRLEAGLALWGEDIDESTTPIEAGLNFAVDLDHEFVGKNVLDRQAAEGPPRKLTGFVMEDKGIPRHGHQVRSPGGAVGSVTSGNISPMLGVGIGMGYLSPPESIESELEVQIRDRWVPAHVARAPFHKG